MTRRDGARKRNKAEHESIKKIDEMTKKELIKVFDERKVRTVWDDKEEKWYFSIVDVVAVLTESADPAAY